MANKNFLDKMGLTYFWNKIKAWFDDNKDASITDDSTSTNIPTSKAVSDFLDNRAKTLGMKNVGFKNKTFDLDDLSAGTCCTGGFPDSSPSHFPYVPTDPFDQAIIYCFYNKQVQMAIRNRTSEIYIRYKFNYWTEWQKLATEDYVTNSELPVNSIVQYDGDTIPNGYEEVNGLVNYSTDEQVVGTWIDGKPIYQKTVTLTGDVSIGQTDLPHGIENLKRCINFECIETSDTSRIYSSIFMV